MRIFKSVYYNLKFSIIITYMKIVSFDVGIKNLSFCLLNDGVIEDWGILNICIDDVCGHCTKNGNPCDKSAKFICGEFRV